MLRLSRDLRLFGRDQRLLLLHLGEVLAGCLVLQGQLRRELLELLAQHRNELSGLGDLAHARSEALLALVGVAALLCQGLSGLRCELAEDLLVHQRPTVHGVLRGVVYPDNEVSEPRALILGERGGITLQAEVGEAQEIRRLPFLQTDAAEEIVKGRVPRPERRVVRCLLIHHENDVDVLKHDFGDVLIERCRVVDVQVQRRLLRAQHGYEQGAQVVVGEQHRDASVRQQTRQVSQDRDALVLHHLALAQQQHDCARVPHHLVDQRLEALLPDHRPARRPQAQLRVHHVHAHVEAGQHQRLLHRRAHGPLDHDATPALPQQPTHAHDVHAAGAREAQVVQLVLLGRPTPELLERRVEAGFALRDAHLQVDRRDHHAAPLPLHLGGTAAFGIFDALAQLPDYPGRHADRAWNVRRPALEAKQRLPPRGRRHGLPVHRQHRLRGVSQLRGHVGPAGAGRHEDPLQVAQRVLLRPATLERPKSADGGRGRQRGEGAHAGDAGVRLLGQKSLEDGRERLVVVLGERHLQEMPSEALTHRRRRGLDGRHKAGIDDFLAYRSTARVHVVPPARLQRLANELGRRGVSVGVTLRQIQVFKVAEQMLARGRAELATASPYQLRLQCVSHTDGVGGGHHLQVREHEVGLEAQTILAEPTSLSETAESAAAASGVHGICYRAVVDGTLVVSDVGGRRQLVQGMLHDETLAAAADALATSVQAALGAIRREQSAASAAVQHLGAQPPRLLGVVDQVERRVALCPRRRLHRLPRRFRLGQNRVPVVALESGLHKPVLTAVLIGEGGVSLVCFEGLRLAFQQRGQQRDRLLSQRGLEVGHGAPQQAHDHETLGHPAAVGKVVLGLEAVEEHLHQLADGRRPLHDIVRKITAGGTAEEVAQRRPEPIHGICNRRLCAG
eukprot:scaffold79_cov259-Pinguiococcus_pyrenoidosus.AAC.42